MEQEEIQVVAFEIIYIVGLRVQILHDALKRCV